MIPIETLIRKISTEDLFDLALGALETIQVPARSWRDGSVAKNLVAIGAQLGADGAAIVADLIAGGFLLLGSGDYLTDHAEDVYGVTRITATFATGTVTLTNRKGAVHTIGANELIVSSSNTSARFRVTDAFVLGSGSETSPTTLDVQVAAIEAGAASSVGPAEIDQLETPLAGVTVANAASLVGRDEESDPQLVTRCLAQRGTWSSLGPRDAYAAAALSALLAGDIPTSINRVAVSRFSSTGQVTVVCATPSGAPSTPELDAVRANIEARARPDTVTVTVSAATTVATVHSIILWCRGGAPALLLANAQKALDRLISTYPIGGIEKVVGAGGRLWGDAVASACVGSSPEVFDVDFVVGGVVVSSAPDTALASNAIPIDNTTFDVRIR